MKLKENLANEFLDWICFNLLIGNNDSHSKNISLLFQDGKNELAPFYDLVCTAIYSTLKKDFAFIIGDRTDFSQMGSNQFNQLEKKLQMKPGTFHQRMNAVMARVETKKDTTAELIKSQFSKAKIAFRISDLIENRIKGLRHQGVR